MFQKIDHVGMIVKDLDESVRLFCDIWGFTKTSDSVRMDPNGEFKSIFISQGDVKLELISPIKAESSFFRYLLKRGEGIHHISIEVDNIDQELDSLKAKGKRLINEKAQSIDSNRVAFVHPESAKGMLIELTQKSP
jgi:methylmalonyl-CoA/ethylmalonyl-CoA epimerase